MATWKVTCWNGAEYVLPEPLAWRLEYGLGSPCDSFWVKTLWSTGQESVLGDAIRMTVANGGETVFFGVVDECECTWSEEGCTAVFSGRGMQALLLDNQAEAVDFGQATLAEILRRYVTPYGITVASSAALPAVWGFSVGSGSSCWKVLYDFARYHGGVTPRFDRRGRLCLSGWTNGTPVEIGRDTPVTKLTFREKRYGVLSQVTVKDVSGWMRQTEVNEAFTRKGGCCGRVMLLPRNTGYQARRYNARFQLERSASRMREVEVTVSIPFAAWPGDLVKVERNEGAGTYRVLESRVTFGEEGCETFLVLGDPNAVL